MATIVVMPALGNSVETCLIISWAVKEGDQVAENDVLCEVETDKAAMEVPSTASGTVLKLLWEEGDEVPVMEPLLIVGEAGEDISSLLDEVGASTQEAEAGDEEPDVEPAGEEAYEGTGHQPEPVSDAAATGPEATETTPSDINTSDSAPAAAPAGDTASDTPDDTAAEPASASGISPRARNLAASKDFDASTVGTGSGPHGRVIERDVADAIASAPATRAGARAGGGAEGTGLGGRVTAADAAGAAPESRKDAAPAPQTQPAARAQDAQGTSTPLKGIRKVIAERMTNALHTTAPVTYNSTAGAQGLLDLRAKLKASPEALGMNRITIGDLVGYAAVRAARMHPSHNAHLQEGTLTTYDVVHMGFACDTPRGLLVPTVFGASQMSLKEFSDVSKELAAQAIEGKISPDLLQGATFTVSNLGGFGIESFNPIINVPQTAILGVSAITPRATVNEKGKVRAEQRIGLSLTADHRVIDGADAARFMADLVTLIENIEFTVMG